MKILIRIIVVFFLLPLPIAFGASWEDPNGGHLGAWKTMWQVDLNKGGLGKKLPNPVIKSNEEKLHEINNFIDCEDHKHKGSGYSKRNGLTHNPVYVATYFNVFHGYHWQAVFNATAIHLILDMATGKSDEGVNGNKNNPQRKRQAIKLWDDITNGKGIKSFPSWAINTGKNVKYDLDEVKKAATLKANDDLRTARKTKNKSNLVERKIAGDKSEKGKNVLKKVARPVQYAITVYESGKMVRKYIDTGEVDLEKAAEAGSRMAGGWVGAEAGAAVGCVVCTPAVATGPGYLACVGVFAIGGGVLGDEAMGHTSQFIIENKEVIEDQLYAAYNMSRDFSDSIVNYDVFEDNKYTNMALEKRKKAIALQIEGKEQESAELIGDAYFFLGYALYEKGLNYRAESIGKIVNILTNESVQYFMLSRTFFRTSIDLSPNNSMSYYFLADSNLMLKNYSEARKYYKKSINYFKRDNLPEWEVKARNMIRLVDKKMS